MDHKPDVPRLVCVVRSNKTQQNTARPTGRREGLVHKRAVSGAGGGGGGGDMQNRKKNHVKSQVLVVWGARVGGWEARRLRG